MGGEFTTVPFLVKCAGCGRTGYAGSKSGTGWFSVLLDGKQIVRACSLRCVYYALDMWDEGRERKEVPGNEDVPGVE